MEKIYTYEPIFLINYNMSSLCVCLNESLIERPSTISSTVVEFIISCILTIIGILIHYKFWKQLEFERKNKPLGRKGNVIEPIMRLFCVHQMYFCPFYFIFYWMRANALIPVDTPSWLCVAINDIVILGRIFISFNSLFVVIIRYIYIVHDVKANQWHFEKVGRRFQIASVIIPLFITMMILFTIDPLLILDGDEIINNCPNIYNTTFQDSKVLKSFRLQFTNQFLPEEVVNSIRMLSGLIIILVYFNVIDAILYIQIFRKIKR